MTKNVRYIRGNRRSSRVIKGDSTYTGLATQTGPVLDQIDAQTNLDGSAPGSLALAPYALYNSSNVVLSWTKTDPTVVEFEVHIDDGANMLQIQKTEGLTLSFERLVPGTTYTVTVYNIYLTGQRGTNFATDTFVAVGDTTIPTTPAGLIVQAGLRALTAVWNDNNDADVQFGLGSYRIEVADDAGFTSIVKDKTVSGTITTVSDLDPDTQYWVRIYAIDQSGNESPASSDVSVTTQQATGNDIIDDAIDRQHIAAAAIGTLEVEDASITNAKVIDMDVAKLRAGTMNAGTVILGGTGQVAASSTVGISGTTGSITSITVDGIEILGATVPFNTSVAQTCEDVATQINLDVGSHGFAGVDTNVDKIEITTPVPGNVYNGHTPVITFTGDMAVDDGVGGHDPVFSGGSDIGLIRSSNYSAGVDGWVINADGDAEFNDVTIRGDLVAGTIALGTNAFHVDSSGNMWWGSSSTYAGASIKISAAGQIFFNGGQIDIGGADTSSWHVASNGQMWSGQGTYSGAPFRVNNNGDVFGDNITATGTLQTASSGDRVVLNNSDHSIRWYDGSDERFAIFLDGSAAQLGDKVDALNLRLEGEQINMVSGGGNVTIKAESGGSIILNTETSVTEVVDLQHDGVTCLRAAYSATDSDDVAVAKMVVKSGGTPVVDHGFGVLGTDSSRGAIKKWTETIHGSEARDRIMAYRPVHWAYDPDLFPGDPLVGLRVHRGFVAEEVAAVDRRSANYGWVDPVNPRSTVSPPSEKEVKDGGFDSWEEWAKANYPLESAVPTMWDMKALLTDAIAHIQFLETRLSAMETR